jgi:hypothetical protein
MPLAWRAKDAHAATFEKRHRQHLLAWIKATMQFFPTIIVNAIGDQTISMREIPEHRVRKSLP